MFDFMHTLRRKRPPGTFRSQAAAGFPGPLEPQQFKQDALEVPSSAFPSDEAVYLRLLVDIAIGLWRLGQKLQSATDEPTQALHRANRSFESLWDTLTQAGAEILDHTDAPFNSGLALTVLAFQPTPGLAHEKVLETIRPTIYYKQHLLQMGQVIVGTPEGQEEVVLSQELTEDAHSMQGEIEDDQSNH